MTIQQHDETGKGYFFAKENDTEAGRMTYTRAGADKLIIDHTEVNPDFAGRGVGKKLLLGVVEFARQQQIKILPLCPFAKSMFQKMPEIRDVLL